MVVGFPRKSADCARNKCPLSVRILKRVELKENVRALFSKGQSKLPVIARCPASSSGASFFAWKRRARNASDWWWTAGDHGKGTDGGQSPLSPSRLPLRAHFHRKRAVWVGGSEVSVKRGLTVITIPVVNGWKGREGCSACVKRAWFDSGDLSEKRKGFVQKKAKSH